MSHLPEKLREWLTAKGWSYRDCAAIAGGSQSTWHRYENGRECIPVHSLVALCGVDDACAILKAAFSDRPSESVPK